MSDAFFNMYKIFVESASQLTFAHVRVRTHPTMFTRNGFLLCQTKYYIKFLSRDTKQELNCE